MKVLKFKRFASVEACERAAALKIYMESFPASERRPVTDLVARAERGDVEFWLAMDDGDVAGIATLWRLPASRWAYVEHLAVSPTLRGSGLGVQMVRWLAERAGVPVVLEAEPRESGELARRRIGFYERLGFKAHHEFAYVQPPYAPELPEVPLTLLTLGSDAPPLEALAKELRERVYCVAGFGEES